MALAAAAAGIAWAQETAQVDPSGTWTWQRTFQENTLNFKLRLTTASGKLAGSLESIRQGDGPQFPAVEIQEAKLDGKNISFLVVRRFNDRQFTVQYRGTLEGDTITGSSELDLNGNPQESPWSAQRVVELADLVGTWQFTIQLQGGGDPIQSTFTLTKQGDAFKGVYNSQFFGQRDAQEIAVKDNQLSFKVVFEQDGNANEFTYTAKPRGDTLTGTIATAFAGADGTPFTGKRQAR